MMDQDPLDHYWIYFITVSGEEYFLDCGMMTFNLAMMVKAEPYCKYALPELSVVPAYFYGEENRSSPGGNHGNGSQFFETWKSPLNHQVSWITQRRKQM